MIMSRGPLSPASSFGIREPVTYLTGLTGIMGGYLWFL